MTTEVITETTTVYERNLNCKLPIVVNVGGAGSSKSYSIAQLLIDKLVTEEHKIIGVCCKTFPSLRRTAMDFILTQLKDAGIYRLDNHHRSINTYSYKDNEIQFFALDEPEKIKSSNFSYIWMEEADAFTFEDFTILSLRLREPSRDGNKNQMYLSLNPTDANGWIPTRLIGREDVELIHSTYHDNPFLDDDYRKLIEDLWYQDENFYKIYALGEWGLLQRRIYTNYKVIPELPDMKEAMWAYGLDFGLVNPSALLKVYILDKQFYLEERLYRTQMTNKDIIEVLSHEDKGDIYGDPTEKQMIAEIVQAGYNAYEGHKEVKAGIDLCQRQTLLIPQSSDNLIKEIQSYQWKEDKDGNILSEPIKFRDHLVDCMRYAIYGLTERYGFATAMPGRKSNTKRSIYFRGGSQSILQELKSARL